MKHPLAVYEGTKTVHAKDSDCRPNHEMDYDATAWTHSDLKEQGYEICDCVGGDQQT